MSEVIYPVTRRDISEAFNPYASPLWWPHTSRNSESKYQFLRAHVSQFRYYAFFIDANWLYCDWWIGERCLYNADFSTSMLAVTWFQRPAWRFKTGSRVNFFSDLTLFVRDFLQREFSRKHNYLRITNVKSISKFTVSMFNNYTYIYIHTYICVSACVRARAHASL